MSQLLDYTKKNDSKSRRKKNRKIIFGSEFSETNNEPSFGIHQKNDKKSSEILIFLKIFEILTPKN